jgi:cold shock CspA family protein
MVPVKFYNFAKGSGFITDEGNDILVHELASVDEIEKK